MKNTYKDLKVMSVLCRTELSSCGGQQKKNIPGERAPGPSPSDKFIGPAQDAIRIHRIYPSPATGLLEAAAVGAFALAGGFVPYVYFNP